MPTRHGWAAAVAAAGTVVTGRLFGVLELYVVGVALAALVLIAVVIVNRPLPRVAVQRVARPATATVGEPARVDVLLTNHGPHRSPRLLLWEPVGARGGAPMQIAALRSGTSASAAYRVPTTRRGTVVVGPLRAERTDPLGLARSTRVLPGTSEVLVVPERVPLAFPSLSSAGTLGTHLRMKTMGRSGSEFHSQREYVPGDDLRRINWKTSARTDTLIVREPAMEGLRHCTVVLDTHADGYDADGFERAISAAASVVTAAAAHGVTTRLVAPGLDVRGPDVAHESLRWLADLQPGHEHVDGTTIGHAHAEGLALLVVVTPGSGSTAERVATRSVGPDDTLVVVATMAAAPIGRRFVVEATSLTALESGWRSLVEGGAG